MLDDLKKERHALSPARDLFKLAVYVIGMLILGITIVAGTRCDGTLQTPPEGEPGSQEAPKELRTLDRAELSRRVADSGDEPYGYASPAIEYLRDLRRDGVLPPVEARVSPAELAAVPLEDARGRSYEVTGRVVEIGREVYLPGSDATGDDRLWSIVLEGEDGSQAVLVKYALGSEFEEGHPREAKPPRSPATRIEVGQFVVGRGVYFQQRTGTLGDTTLPKPAPTLSVGPLRILLPPSEHNAVISSLDEALWGDVQDRYSRESRRWDEDAVFEVIQWARARGYEACREDLRNGTLPWKEWGDNTFGIWKKEVSVAGDEPRPFTTESRGHVFRTGGIIGEVLQFGWERIPSNRWNIDEFQVLTMLSDHYQNVALRAFLPFGIDTFPGITGARAEHVRIYGVFIKNDTYDSKFKREDGSKRSLPITAPMFVVLHMEPYPEGEAAAGMRTLMWWIAGSMVLFGLLFYIVLIRGGAKQTERMEAHRLQLRQRMRAKGDVPLIEGGKVAPATDAAAEPDDRPGTPDKSV
jgi:hypothetical protein